MPTPDNLKIRMQKLSEYIYGKGNYNDHLDTYTTIEIIHQALESSIDQHKFKKCRSISLNMTYLVTNIIQDLRNEELKKIF